MKSQVAGEGKYIRTIEWSVFSARIIIATSHEEKKKSCLFVLKVKANPVRALLIDESRRLGGSVCLLGGVLGGVSHRVSVCA